MTQSLLITLFLANTILGSVKIASIVEVLRLLKATWKAESFYSSKTNGKTIISQYQIPLTSLLFISSFTILSSLRSNSIKCVRFLCTIIQSAVSPSYSTRIKFIMFSNSDIVITLFLAVTALWQVDCNKHLTTAVRSFLQAICIGDSPYYITTTKVTNTLSSWMLIYFIQ